eukprot:281463-Pelagomonas_calceolata.AAC.3
MPDRVDKASSLTAPPDAAEEAGSARSCRSEDDEETMASGIQEKHKHATGVGTMWIQWELEIYKQTGRTARKVAAPIFKAA